MESEYWIKTTLGEEVDLETGFPFRSALYTEDPTGVRLLRGDNIGQGSLRWDGVKRWPADQVEGVAKYQLREGDVVVAMDRPWIEAGLKYAAVSEDDQPSLLVQRVARLRGRETLDTGFLRYLIGSEDFKNHVLAVQTGTAVPHISGSQIREFSFLRPPLQEQKVIGSLLGALDKKIELNRRTIQTSDALARAIFKSWFVDFDPVRERHSLFPGSFEDSVIGPIPLSWQVGALSDLCEVALGGDWGEDRPFEGAVEVACLRGVDLEQLRKVGEAYPPRRWTKSSSVEKRRMTGRDVIVAASGAGPVGRTLWISSVLVGSFDVPLVYSNFCKRLTADSIDVAIYIDFVLDEMRNTGETFDYVTGTSVPNLDLQGLLRLVVPIPPPQILEAFASIVVPIRERLYSEENRTLAALRDALLPKLLSGEIRVKQAEKIVGEAV